MRVEFNKLEHENRELIYTLDVSPDGKLLALGQQSDPAGHAYLTLWDLETLTMLRVVESKPQKLIFRTRFSPDGRTLVYAKSDSAIYFHDLKSQETFKPEQPDDDVRWLSFAVTENRLVTAGSMIQVWDAERRVVLNALPGGASAQSPDQLALAALSPDGTQVAVAGDGTGTVSLHDSLTGAKLKTLDGAPNRARWVSFSPHARYLAVIEYYSHGAFLWDLRSGQRHLPEIFNEKSEEYWSLSFHPDGERLAFGMLSDYVVIARLQDGKFVFDKPVHQGRVWDLTFTRDGKRLVSGGDDGIAYVWNLS